LASPLLATSRALMMDELGDPADSAILEHTIPLDTGAGRQLNGAAL